MPTQGGATLVTNFVRRDVDRAAQTPSTYVPSSVVEFVGGGQTWLGSTTLNAVATPSSAGVPAKFAASTVALTDAVTTAGTPKKIASSTVALTDAVATAGTPKKIGASTVSLTDQQTTAGRLTRFSASLVALTDQRTTAGTRTLTTSSSVQLVDARTTNARLSARAAVNPVRPAVNVTTGPARLGVHARTTTSEQVLVRTDTATTGNRFGASTVALTGHVTTAGARRVYGQTHAHLNTDIAVNAVPAAVSSATVALQVTFTIQTSAATPLPPARIVVVTPGSLEQTGDGYLEQAEAGVLAGVGR